EGRAGAGWVGRRLRRRGEKTSWVAGATRGAVSRERSLGSEDPFSPRAVATSGQGANGAPLPRRAVHYPRVPSLGLSGQPLRRTRVMASERFARAVAASL